MIEELLRFIPGEKPMVILICGNVGTGKTWLAQKLAQKLNAIHLNTDALRKRLFCNPKFTLKETEQTYRELLAKALTFLEQERNIILDGTYIKIKFRHNVYQALRKKEIPFVVFWTTSPEKVVKQRLVKKFNSDPDNPSEADFTVYQKKKKQIRSDPAYSTPFEDKGVRVIEIDTDSKEIKKKNF